MQKPKRHWSERDMPNLAGKVAVVTGVWPSHERSVIATWRGGDDCR